MRKTDEQMEAVAAPPRSETPIPEDREPRASDGDLLLRIADGDSVAFDILYRRFSRPVLGLALRLLRDRSRAEDAVQETFAAIWRSAGSYRPDRGRGAPWLYAVARNAIVDRARARREPTFPDVPAEERERLRRAHDLLVAAGPLPELPPELEHRVEPAPAEVVSIFMRRRAAVVGILAAALAALAFGGGFLIGHSHRGGFAAAF